MTTPNHTVPNPTAAAAVAAVFITAIVVAGVLIGAWVRQPPTPDPCHEAAINLVQKPYHQCDEGAEVRLEREVTGEAMVQLVATCHCLAQHEGHTDG